MREGPALLDALDRFAFCVKPHQWLHRARRAVIRRARSASRYSGSSTRRCAASRASRVTLLCVPGARPRGLPDWPGLKAVRGRRATSLLLAEVAMSIGYTRRSQSADLNPSIAAGVLTRTGKAARCGNARAGFLTDSRRALARVLMDCLLLDNMLFHNGCSWRYDPTARRLVGSCRPSVRPTAAMTITPRHPTPTRFVVGTADRMTPFRLPVCFRIGWLTRVACKRSSTTRFRTSPVYRSRRRGT